MKLKTLPSVNMWTVAMATDTVSCLKRASSSPSMASLAIQGYPWICQQTKLKKQNKPKHAKLGLLTASGQFLTSCI